MKTSPAAWIVVLSAATFFAGCGIQGKLANSSGGRFLNLPGADGESNDDGEVSDGEMNDANEKVLETASIKLAGNETPEQRQAMAKITADTAQATALAQVAGGTVTRVDLDDENGFLVYSVDIQKDGVANDVKIDAGDGKFLYIDASADTGAESSKN